MEPKSVATLKKTRAEIAEFEEFIKSEGYDSRPHFFGKVWDNFVKQKRAGIKLFYPVRLMTDEEEKLLAKIEKRAKRTNDVKPKRRRPPK